MVFPIQNSDLSPDLARIVEAKEAGGRAAGKPPPRKTFGGLLATQWPQNVMTKVNPIHTYICVYLFIYLFIYLFVYLSIYIYTHTHTHLIIFFDILFRLRSPLWLLIFSIRPRWWCENRSLPEAPASRVPLCFPTSCWPMPCAPEGGDMLGRKEVYPIVAS